MQAHLLITGSVQGVGYRQFVKQQAKRMGIHGWVKNLPDSSVAALLQGEKEAINQMIENCREGSFLSQIKNIVITWENDTQKYTSFEILH